MIGTEEYQKNKEEIIRKFAIEPNNKLIQSPLSEEYQQQFSTDDDILGTFEAEDDVSQLDDTENSMYYHYLEDNFLDQHFSLCTREMEKYTVYFCMYSVQMTINPFLKFVLTTNTPSREYSFPSMEFACSQKDDVDTYFKNECVKNVITILNMDHITPDQIDYMYEGFIEEDNNIYVVFDIGKLTFSLSSEYEYAIIDEIINYRSVKNVAIEKHVVDFFYKHDYMIHLSTIKDEPIQYPITVYNVVNENELTNVYYKDTEPYDNVHKFNHPLLGDNYYFSSIPIDNNYTNIVRYGFFSYNIKFIVPDITRLKKDDIPNYTESTYFHENGRQYWCVKNINRIFVIQ